VIDGHQLAEPPREMRDLDDRAGFAAILSCGHGDTTDYLAAAPAGLSGGTAKIHKIERHVGHSHFSNHTSTILPALSTSPTSSSSTLTRNTCFERSSGV